MHMNRVIWQHMSINMCLDHMASVQEEDGSGEQDGNNNEDGGLVMGSKEGGSSTSGIIINIIGGDNRYRQYSYGSSAGSSVTPSPPTQGFGLSPPGESKLAQRRQLGKARSLNQEIMVG
jgi:hypothetical protein